MDFGISIAASVDSWKTVKRAETLGFKNAWFFDTQMLSADMFISMSLAAANTTSIRIGTGVLVPSNRIPPVTAGSLATLNVLAPGRIDFGIGTGHTARRTMGLSPYKLEDMKNYIRVVRGLLRGQTEEWEFEGESHSIRIMNPEFGLVNLEDKIPVHISAMGPKSIEMAAQEGDGWITVRSQIDLAKQDMDLLKNTLQQHNRKPSNILKTVFSYGCVLSENEPYDSPRALAQAGPQVASLFHRLVEGSIQISLPTNVNKSLSAYRQIYDNYIPHSTRYLENHTGHLLFLRPDEKPFITADAVKQLTFTGPFQEMVDRIRYLETCGYDQWVINIPPGQDEALESWARVIEKV